PTQTTASPPGDTEGSLAASRDPRLTGPPSFRGRSRRPFSSQAVLSHGRAHSPAAPRVNAAYARNKSCRMAPAFAQQERHAMAYEPVVPVTRHPAEASGSTT